MKVTFEFSEEDEHKVKIFQKAEDFYLALSDLENYLRNTQKYQDKIPENFIDHCRDIICDSGFHKIE